MQDKIDRLRQLSRANRTPQVFLEITYFWMLMPVHSSVLVFVCLPDHRFKPKEPQDEF
jgi:hypothetical protein